MSDNTTFHRCPHDKENPYAQISRALIRDNSISPLLRFLLIFLLSQKDGWKVKIKQIINLFADHQIGKDKIYSIVNEGIEAGYIERIEWLEKGLKRTSYQISETPKFKKSLPCPAQPDAAGPDPAEQKLKEEHHTSKDVFNKKEELKAPSPPPTFTYHKISMPEEKYKKLIDDFGEEKVKAKIEALHEYSEIKFKRFKEYTNHAMVIRKWINEDMEKEKNQSNPFEGRKNSVRWKGKKIL